MSAQRVQEPEWAEFLDRLVHDLREPLRSINAFSELLQEVAKDRLGAEGDEVLGEILSGTTRIRTLVDGVSGYSLALHTSTGAASLQSALNIAVAALGDRIDACGATVTGVNLPKVAVSLERLIQLLENLIGNSLRFHGEAPPVIEVSARPCDTAADDGGWIVQIEDNGIGVDPADCEAIFNPFFRVHGRKYPGAGLGLSTCRRIVESHGGSIRMNPRPAGGAICTLTLPAA
jgi:signal transduction histidine kinase